jgi:hypothetical protein
MVMEQIRQRITVGEVSFEMIISDGRKQCRNGLRPK